MEPRVSVIIPVKNCESTVEALLDSLMKVDYPSDRLEVIVVDGGSEDRTLERASRYRVRIFREPGYGPGYGRMKGVEESSGEILAFTDGDCVVPRHWLKVMVEDLSDPRVGCVGGGVYLDPACKGNVYAEYFDESIIPVMPRPTRRSVLDRLKPFSHLAFANLGLRREALESVGGLDVRFKTFEDMDLLQRLCDRGYKIILDPRVYVWHKHRQSLRGLLTQVYRYGRGGPGFRRKHPRSLITRYYRFGLACFYLIVFLSASTSILGFLLEAPHLLLLSFSPFAAGYLACSIRYLSKLKSPVKACFYPLLDLLRVTAFCLGDLVSTVSGPSMEEGEDGKN